MDKSKEYMIMCGALPKEIVEEFEKIIGGVDEIGSVAVLTNGNTGCIGTHWPEWQIFDTGRCYMCTTFDTPATRLYTQDQLQKISMNSSITSYELLKKFICIIESDVIKNYSMEQYWLEFAVYEKFKKEWDGNEWIGE